MMSVWALIKSGGWVMYPLVACSVIVWGVCIERFLAFRNWQEKNKNFLLSFSNFWLKGDFEQAKKICESSDVELARLGTEIVHARSIQMPKEKFLAKLDRKRLEQSSEMKKFLWLLGTIGSAAPFIGLLGTVIGIIKSFQSMAEAGAGGFAVVAAGISEALVATAAGIIVAVIALFFYNYFQTKVGLFQFRLKLFTQDLADLFDTSNDSQHSLKTSDLKGLV